MNENAELSLEMKKEPESAAELSQYVAGVLKLMESNLESISEKVLSQVDELTKRVDDLEKNITELMTQVGGENPEK